MTVYPQHVRERGEMHARGKGLNKRAIVRLRESAKTKKKNAERVRHYTEHTLKAKFLELNEETGEWTYMVNHF